MALQTSLHAAHAALGASFTEFAGYEMPVHYGSIVDEHVAVREKVGLFDVGHMSNVWVTGAGAAATLSRVAPTDFAALEVGRGKYSVLLGERGTILDDVFVFRFAEDRFFMVPNAGRNEVVVRHFKEHTVGDVAIEDVSRDWGILALQGPVARDVLKAASDDPGPKFHRIADMTIGGVSCMVSGTGYTGEKGVEVYMPAEAAPVVWGALLEAGAAHGIQPVGLGARDTLRLEKGYCLAGNEFEGGRTPLEAGLDWLVDWDVEFLGRSALLMQRGGEHDLLMGLVQEKGIPRKGYPVHSGGETIGVVTSGTMSPTLGQPIGLAYLRGASIGDSVRVEVRGRLQDATVVKTPFV